MFRRVTVGWMLVLLALASTARGAENALTFSTFRWTAHADRGSVTLTYHLTPSNRSADVAVQIYARWNDVGQGKRYDQIVPAKGGALPVISLFKGIDNTGNITVTLPRGAYGDCRVLLYRSPDGKSANFNEILYDSLADTKNPRVDLALAVSSEGTRVTAPILVVGKDVITRSEGNGLYEVIIPASVRLPRHFTVPDNGFWAMAKGADGFSQVWAALNKAVMGGDPHDDYDIILITFTLKNVKSGLGNLQFGLFHSNFGTPICWLYPGLDYEVGDDSWIVRAPTANRPVRLRVRSNRFETLAGEGHDFYAARPAAKKAVRFVRGGNYGNAITWKANPELNHPGYFVLLKEMGCCFLRFNFNPDRFLEERVYQHAVEQVVENMWTAGLYPIIAPQDLPSGRNVEERIEKGERVCRLMAARFKDKSVWIEVCNEPHEFVTWEAWKPVALRYVHAVRAVDPEAFVIVPFENYSRDGRGAARSPLPRGEVDLYDGHAYVAPKDMVALFAPALKAGLPVMIGEYGGGADFLRKVDAQLQELPGLMAAGPWAFTIYGEDALALIRSGATAELKYTPSGQVIADDYARWDAGKLRFP